MDLFRIIHNKIKKPDEEEDKSNMKEKDQREEILKKMPAPFSLLSSISSDGKGKI